MSRAVALALVLATAALAQENAAQRAEWNAPARPFRILANLHYVGTAGLSSFLIATPAGHILIDGGLPESAPLIARNIQALGFRLADVKILLNSHAHFDHAGGLAELKRLTGARLLVHAADAAVMASGRIDYGPSAGTRFPRATVDETLTDGQVVSLGGTSLTLLHTPGHTKGCSAWLATLGGRRVVFHGSTTVAGNPLRRTPAYPHIVTDYLKSFRRLAGVPCDVFLAPHAGFFRLAEKRGRGEAAFVDPTELARFNARSEADFRRELANASAGAR